MHPSASFLEDLKDRGLRSPLLVISDGGNGLCAAIETSFPDSLHPVATELTRSGLRSP
ncbi:MAG: transposase [Acidimicrobiales bacterium]